MFKKHWRWKVSLCISNFFFAFMSLTVVALIYFLSISFFCVHNLFSLHLSELRFKRRFDFILFLTKSWWYKNAVSGPLSSQKLLQAVSSTLIRVSNMHIADDQITQGWSTIYIAVCTMYAISKPKLMCTTCKLYSKCRSLTAHRRSVVLL